MPVELMSPAGNLDSFIVAIENGADAVYLGLRKFNARKPAENFSVHNLKKVINYAHQYKKKVYLTLNIDLRSNELKEISQILELAKVINIDAIIIKDPSLIYIINKFYKNDLIMHFSTQNAICSSLGVEFAKKVNIKRVILARELELSEIKKACTISGIECEIFVEGSMCFSISGRCFMSSWVGGRSGNRGVCTAPCRVLWEINNKKDAYFSMKDLSLIELLEEFQEIGVVALKIEGRLKKSSWVAKITDLYRKAVDKKLDFKTINNELMELKKFSAREIDKGHIFKHNELTGNNEEWQNYKITGSDASINDYFNEYNEISIDSDNKYFKISIKLFGISSEIKIQIPNKPKKAKLVGIGRIIEQLESDKLINENKFKINIENKNINLTSSFIQKIIKEIQNNIKEVIREEERLPDLPDDILSTISYENKVLIKDRLLGDYPDKIIISPDQSLSFLKNSLPVKTVVISLIDIIDIKTVKQLEEKYHLILSIPPVLYEKEADKIRDYITELNNKGFKNFEANSYTGISLLEDIKCNKSLGVDMPVMNHLAAKFFYELGYLSVYITPEGDKSIYQSLSSIIANKIEILVFGKIKLFQSRVKSDFFKNKSVFKDKFGIEVECYKENSLNIFVSKKPLSLIHEQIKKEKIFFDSLTADLRYFNNPINTLELIYKNYFKVDNSSTFNFYRKLV